jgi:hypothetical protein
MSIRFRPHTSDNIPAGILAMIPVKADIPAMTPTPAGPAPRCSVNKGRTGLFEMVELNMANRPEAQRTIKGEFFEDILSLYQDHHHFI